MNKMLRLTLISCLIFKGPILSNETQEKTSYKDILIGSVIGAGLCGALITARSKSTTLIPQSKGVIRSFISNMLPWSRKNNEIKHLQDQIAALQEQVTKFDSTTNTLATSIKTLKDSSEHQSRLTQQEVARLKTYTVHRTDEIKKTLAQHGEILTKQSDTLDKHTQLLQDHTIKIDELQKTADIIHLTSNDTNIKVTFLDDTVKKLLAALAQYTQNSRRSFWKRTPLTLEPTSEQQKLH